MSVPDGGSTATNGSASEPMPVDRLMAEVVDGADEIVSAQRRLRRLVAAGRTVVSDLSLDTVLRRIVEAARDLVGARYAALGVIGPEGGLEQFIHVGVEAATVAAIGELPKGRGVLGALIDDPRPIRLGRIAADARSAGFPPGHPDMTTFLGVPIRSRNAVFGNLYLTERSGGGFTAEDEEIVLALAATAGVAIENARLYGESGRRQRWLQASTDVTRALLAGTGRDTPLRLITEHVTALAEADVVAIVLEVDAETLEVVVASGASAADLEGLRYARAGSLAALAMTSGHGVMRSSGGGVPPAEPVVELGGLVAATAGMAVPLMSTSKVRGAILVARLGGRPPFTDAEREMAETFAGQAAVAWELAEARADHERLAVLGDRDRIARDLHDQVIQRLFGAGLMLHSCAAASREPATSAKLTEVVDYLDETIRQIRTSIFQLRSEDVVSGRVRSRVVAVTEEIAESSALPIAVSFSGPVDTVVDDSLAAEVEAVVREGITNVVRHARARRLDLSVAVAGGRLVVEVGDDGVGFDRAARRSGLANLEDRARRLQGDFAVESAVGGGTRLCWSVPSSATDG